MPAAVRIGNCIEVSRLSDGSADAKVVAANKEK